MLHTFAAVKHKPLKKVFHQSEMHFFPSLNGGVLVLSVSLPQTVFVRFRDDGATSSLYGPQAVVLNTEYVSTVSV